MSKAKITMLGLLHFHSGLFDQLVLPEGVEKEIVINTILDESADFEVIYADPFFTENMVGLISRKWQRTFQKWYDALQLEYNPIENYDRYEHWTDDSTGKETQDTTANSTESSAGSGQTDTYVNTYDSDTLHQDGRSTSTQSANSSGTDTSNSEANTTDNSVHDGRMHGNIGITTSQYMLRQELEISGWNLYEHIANVFIQELCIMVY